jgi:spermidine synthase
VLPLALGVHGAYLVAIGLDLTVGVTALVLARGVVARVGAPVAVDDRGQDVADGERHAGDVTAPATAAAPLRPAVVGAVAGVSGASTLGVEVAWTRLAAQVLQNSTYTYAVVLATFLLALACGSLLAAALDRPRWRTSVAPLAILLVLSTLATAASPWLFHAMTDGLAYVGADLGWRAYLVAVASTALVVMFVCRGSCSVPCCRRCSGCSTRRAERPRRSAGSSRSTPSVPSSDRSSPGSCSCPRSA